MSTEELERLREGKSRCCVTECSTEFDGELKPLFAHIPDIKNSVPPGWRSFLMSEGETFRIGMLCPAHAEQYYPIEKLNPGEALKILDIGKMIEPAAD